VALELYGKEVGLSFDGSTALPEERMTTAP
jgi:hypothetical protein